MLLSHTLDWGRKARWKLQLSDSEKTNSVTVFIKAQKKIWEDLSN